MYLFNWPQLVCLIAFLNSSPFYYSRTYVDCVCRIVDGYYEGKLDGTQLGSMAAANGSAQNATQTLGADENKIA